MTEHEIESFEDYLADVLCIWDCYKQEWADNAPQIFRFENADVLFKSTKDPGLRQLSLLDSGDDQSILLDFISSKASADNCFCWVSKLTNQSLIGDTVSLISLRKCIKD